MNIPFPIFQVYKNLESTEYSDLCVIGFYAGYESFYHAHDELNAKVLHRMKIPDRVG
jgi:hypothetical protein